MRGLLPVQVGERDPRALRREKPARLVDSVLFPTPPFGFATTITVMNSPKSRAAPAAGQVPLDCGYRER